MAGRRTVLAVGAAAAGAFFLWPRLTPNGNPFETQAVKNVGDAYSAGGGTTTHAPAVATKRGDPTSNVSPQTRMQGVGTSHFDENHANQKAGEPGSVEKAFRGAHYGNDKGK